MSDAVSDSKPSKPQAAETAVGWANENLWKPVRDNVCAPFANVGVQAINATHVTDGFNLAKHATNALGLTDAADSQKLQPFDVPKPTNFGQRVVQDVSSTASTLLLYTAIAKVGSKVFGGSSQAFAAGERNTSLLAEESRLLKRPLLTTADLMRQGQKISTVMAKEQNALLFGATFYGAVRDPMQGETRLGNALGNFTQFGLYRAGNAKWNSSFSEESGLLNKVRNVAVPRALVGMTAGLAQDFVSNTVSQSIDKRTFVPSMSADWKDGATMSAAINVVLPSLLGGKGVRAPGEVPTGDVGKGDVPKGNVVTGDMPAKPVEPGQNVRPVETGKIATPITTLAETPLSHLATERVLPNPETAAESSAREKAPVVETPASEKAAQTGAETHTPAVGEKVGRVGGTNPDYPGIDESDTVKRVISKPNGSVVTLFDSGKIVIKDVGEKPSTRSAEGFVYNVVDGKLVETIPRRAMPMERRPLNVASGAVEDIGKQLSNFTERPFTFHGKMYRSVEAWYQGLKWPDEAKRAEIADRTGVEAKRGGRGAPKSDTFTFEGKDYKFGSPEHLQLVKDAIKASLEQNPQAKADFMVTHPRPIEHKTGRPENPNSALPGTKFAKILEEIRQEFVDEANAAAKAPLEPAQGSAMSGHDPKEADKANGARSANKSDAREELPAQGRETAVKPVSQLINEIRDAKISNEFNLPAFAEAFEGSNLQATSFRGVENDGLTFNLPDGNVLRIVHQNLTPEEGTRPFDLPVVERGTVQYRGEPISYFVQPDAPQIAPSQFDSFVDHLTQSGYKFTDASIGKVVSYNGEPRLTDPFAVTPFTDAEKAQARRNGYSIP